MPAPCDTHSTVYIVAATFQVDYWRAGELSSAKAGMDKSEGGEQMASMIFIPAEKRDKYRYVCKELPISRHVATGA